MLDETTERGARPEVAVIGIASARVDVQVLAPRRVGEAEPRFVRHAQHQVPLRHAGQLAERIGWLVQVFQHFETANGIEAVGFPGMS
ncbi:MAG: hypothetical protein R2848_03285 [Thermomicrobiales bacterium]